MSKKLSAVLIVLLRKYAYQKGKFAGFQPRSNISMTRKFLVETILKTYLESSVSEKLEKNAFASYFYESRLGSAE